MIALIGAGVKPLEPMSENRRRSLSLKKKTGIRYSELIVPLIAAFASPKMTPSISVKAEGCFL
jgi:hypothetical protein